MLKLVFVVALFAALVYALMWTLERRRLGGAPRPRRPPARPVAPDDDDDFLRSLRRRGRDPQ